MIIVTFILNDMPIATRKIDQHFNQRNCASVRDYIRLRLIDLPENYDRYELSAEEMDDLWGWVLGYFYIIVRVGKCI